MTMGVPSDTAAKAAFDSKTKALADEVAELKDLARSEERRVGKECLE